MAKRVPLVMIIDDEEAIRKLLSRVVEAEGLRSITVPDGTTALDLMRMETPDAILTDVKMPGFDGFELLKKVKAIDAGIPVIIVTGFADVQQAVTAIRDGAHDYISKPFDNLEVIRVIRRALNERGLKKDLKRLSERLEGQMSLIELMGPSEIIERLSIEVGKVAKSSFSVVIVGETGVGKEMVAKAIHAASSRARAPFVAVDCSAIPENLLESELFGHEKDAFTGAGMQKLGKFELAHKGTLFMDEISSLPLSLQAEILRVIQEKKLNRMGNVEPVEVDTRLIVATKLDLEELKNQGKFRKDLQYKLSDFTIHVPPLREHRDDITFLAKHFLDKANAELNKQVSGFSREAVDSMLAFDWPGNIRQLKAMIRRATLMAKDVIGEDDLGLKPVFKSSRANLSDVKTISWNGTSLAEIVRNSTLAVEREVLTEVLKYTNGNKAKAARLLRIDYKTLHMKLKKFGITIEKS